MRRGTGALSALGLAAGLVVAVASVGAAEKSVRASALPTATVRHAFVSTQCAMPLHS